MSRAVLVLILTGALVSGIVDTVAAYFLPVLAALACGLSAGVVAMLSGARWWDVRRARMRR